MTQRNIKLYCNNYANINYKEVDNDEYYDCTIINFNLLNGFDSSDILRQHPQFVEYCNFHKLNKWHWNYLLYYRPYLIKYYYKW